MTLREITAPCKVTIVDGVPVREPLIEVHLFRCDRTRQMVAACNSFECCRARLPDQGDHHARAGR